MAGVTIKSITVPSAVENNSGPVVLDCEYSLLESEKGPPVQLVVRWFFNDLPDPVYQWIPGTRPQDNGPLKGTNLTLSFILSSHLEASQVLGSSHLKLHRIIPGRSETRLD